MARRILSAIVGTAVTMVVVSAGPPRVAAATIASVDFPAESSGYGEVVLDVVFPGTADMGADPPITGCNNPSPNWGTLGGQSGTGGSPSTGTLSTSGGSGGSICRNLSTLWWIPDPGTDYEGGASYEIVTKWGGDTGVTFTMGFAAGQVNGTVTESSQLGQGSSCTTGGSFQGAGGCVTTTTLSGAGAANTVGMFFRWTSPTFSGVQRITVTALEPITGGDCIGVGSMAGGPTIEHINGDPDWGALWLEIAGEGYCLGSVQGQSNTPTVVTWSPGIPVMIPGAVYCIESEWHGSGAIRVYATESDGGAAWQMAGYNSAPGVSLERTVCTVAQDFGYGLRFEYPAGVYNGGQLLRDGTEEELTTFPDGKAPIQVDKNVDDSVGEFCGDPPADFLAVGEWVAYLACVARVGFQMVVNWVGEVVTAIGLLPGLIAAAIGLAFDTVGAVIATAIEAGMILVGDVLEFLFVPTELGAEWEAFSELFGSKVPFVWVVEAGSFLTGALTAANVAGPGIDFSMEIMGAEIEPDVAGSLAPLSAVRPALVWVVWIGAGLAVMGRIRGALGDSAPEQMRMPL